MAVDSHREAPGASKKEPAGPSVHLDTSLIIEQHKPAAKSDPVKEALRVYPIRSTSSYARKEFKRAWLQDLNLIYKVAEGCQSILQVYTKIDNSTWASQRRLRRCLAAIEAHLESYPKLSLTAAVAKLRSSVAEAILGAYELWDRSATHEVRGTGCVRALERPFRATNGTIDVTVPRCKPSKIQCKVHTFFKENHEAFVRIEEAVGKANDPSEELQKTTKTIEKAQRSPEFLCDDKNCSAMSDALIAVDGLHADHLAANNDKEWETLAGALGKPLLNPVTGTFKEPSAAPKSAPEDR